jgi:hypothetical protein
MMMGNTVAQMPPNMPMKPIKSASISMFFSFGECFDFNGRDDESSEWKRYWEAGQADGQK